MILFFLVYGIWYILEPLNLFGGDNEPSSVDILDGQGSDLDVSEEAVKNPVTTITSPSSEMDIVDFVTAFYETINRAGNEGDLQAVLDHLGNLPKDSSFWWDFQVRYNIYRCSDPNTIYVGLTYFYRGNNFTTPQNETPEILKYTLDVIDNEWQFVTGDNRLGSVSSSCQLAASNWPNQ